MKVVRPEVRAHGGVLKLVEPEASGPGAVRLVRNGVGSGAGKGAAELARRQQAEAARARWLVEEENRAAAGLSPTDARWVLAARTTRLLQGGTSAILTPESRAKLLVLSKRMGLRAFDASLVIAIAQDAARRGEPLGEECEGRLRLVRPPVEETSAAIGWWGILSAVVLGAGMFAILAHWVTSA